jgi:hypothetical protein
MPANAAWSTVTPTTYFAHLSGQGESPPNVSPGTGFAEVDLDLAAHTMRVRVSFSGLLSTTTASHIHACTTTPGAGTAGVATQVPSFEGFPLGVTSGAYDRTFDTSDASTYNPAYVTANGGTAATAEAALAACMAAGGAYLNIHSIVFPGGEIRGFLIPNLAPDPDFEASPFASYSTNGSGTFSWATDQSHSATHSLKIVSTNATLNRWLSAISAIPATAGAQYTACVFLKTLNASGPAYLAVNFWNASNTYIPATLNSATSVGGTTDWTQVCLTTTAPTGSTHLRVEFRLPSVGTLWADDVSVTTP